MAIVLLGYPLHTVDLPPDVAEAVASGDPTRVMALRLEYTTFEALQTLNLVRVLMESVKRADDQIRKLDAMITGARDALNPK